MNPIPLSTFLTALSLSFAAHAAEADYVYAAGQGGYASYRIPAIVKSAEGSLLAFAEGRVHSAADHGDIDLVLRRSEDGGANWQDLILVRDDGKSTCGNPAPVVLGSGRILLISCGSAGSERENMHEGVPREIYVQHSDDDGKTWSEATNITAQAREKDWGWFATGPCNAIVIQKGKHAGRIIIPSNHSLKVDGKVRYEGSCFYSDDEGKTWTRGEATDGNLSANESSIAEAAPDLLVQAFRSQSGMAKRLLRYSRDGGATWTDEQPADELVPIVCQGSLISDSAEEKRLYFSCPGVEKKRQNMTIYTSPDAGKSWPAAFTIRTGFHAYSNLVELDNKTLGILYETERGVAPLPTSGIIFETVKKESVLQSKNPLNREQ